MNSKTTHSCWQCVFLGTAAGHGIDPGHSKGGHWHATSAQSHLPQTAMHLSVAWHAA